MDNEPPPVMSMPPGEHPLFREVVGKFRASFGYDPMFIVRVPGRVNLIGEHIDYCGYSVLPMALEQFILIAIKPSDDKCLRIVNVSDQYESHESSVSDLTINLNDGVMWFNYVLCGIRGVNDVIERESCLRGMSMAVAGNILPNSGLSSSSALVCAAALGTAFANKLNLSRQELASICARCEKYIGTEGGGMDQAIAFLATEGCAKYISFKPFCASNVRLPIGSAIVVAHSLAELNKAASSHFNCRVAECRLAALVIAHESSLQDWRQLCSLADVQARLNMNLRSMPELVKKILKHESYQKDQICDLLGVSRNELEAEFLPQNTWLFESFKLKQRALHVFEEAFRVEEFREICRNDRDIHALGNLMNLSHDSLRDLYECSHKQLDALVATARAAGALGARLTGAGWGGCMIALINEDKAQSFVNELKKFYSELQVKQDSTSVIFSSTPGCGAVVYYPLGA